MLEHGGCYRFRPRGISSPSYFYSYLGHRPLFVAQGAVPWTPHIDQREFFRVCEQLGTVDFKVNAEPKDWQTTQFNVANELFKQEKARSGAPTIVLDRVEHIHLPTRHILRWFDVPWTWTRVPTVFMSYSAPGGGVGVHYDDDDNIIVQVQGSRRWRVSRDRVLPSYPDRDGGIKLDETNSDEWILCPGDLLYIPRGYWHDGNTLEESISVTFGWDSLAVSEILAHILAYKIVTQPSSFYYNPELNRLLNYAELINGPTPKIYSDTYDTIVASLEDYISTYCPRNIRSYDIETLEMPDIRMIPGKIVVILHNYLSEIFPSVMSQEDVLFGFAAFVTRPIGPWPETNDYAFLQPNTILEQSAATMLSYSLLENQVILFAFGDAIRLGGKWKSFCEQLCNQSRFSIKDAQGWQDQEHFDLVINLLTLLLKRGFIFFASDSNYC